MNINFGSYAIIFIVMAEIVKRIANETTTTNEHILYLAVFMIGFSIDFIISLNSTKQKEDVDEVRK